MTVPVAVHSCDIHLLLSLFTSAILVVEWYCHTFNLHFLNSCCSQVPKKLFKKVLNFFKFIGCLDSLFWVYSVLGLFFFNCLFLIDLFPIFWKTQYRSFIKYMVLLWENSVFCFQTFSFKESVKKKSSHKILWLQNIYTGFIELPVFSLYHQCLKKLPHCQHHHFINEKRSFLMP